jgi:hypothetical protein
MTHADLVTRIAGQAGVSRDTAVAVLEALGVVTGPDRAGSLAAASMAPERDAIAHARYEPTAREVDELIAAAMAHPLGLEFLAEGDLGAVAITFRAHAFTVDRARREVETRGLARARGVA